MSERPKKTRPRRNHRKPDPITAPDQWLTENALACYHALAPLDEVAREMEHRWGVDRLPRLVSVETAAKFGKICELLDAAIDACDLEGVQKRARNAIRGWQAMDAEAAAAGHEPPRTDAWPVRIGDEQQRAWIVQDPTAFRALRAEVGGDDPIYTLDEIGRLLGLVPAALAAQDAKRGFPGAEVTDTLKMETAE